jgi:hypothetical protein
MLRDEVGESPLQKTITTPEEIAERKIIVYKPRIDIKSVKATAEKMKTQLFRKFVFMKPKPEEVQLVSINKYFEQYVLVDGEYSIDYSKNWIHNIQVDETMQELALFGEKIRAKSLKGHLGMPCKILQLHGEGRFKREAKARIIFDKQWREVGLEQLPFVPFEEQPEKVLSNLDQFGNDGMSTEKEVEFLKSRIVRRPSEILCIHKELFKVSERAVIYKPMYKVTVRNVKTKKEATITIDAITGKLTSTVQQTPAAPQKKKTAKEPKKPSSSAKTAAKKFVTPVKKTKNKVEPKPTV